MLLFPNLGIYRAQKSDKVDEKKCTDLTDNTLPTDYGFLLHSSDAKRMQMSFVSSD